MSGPARSRKREKITGILTGEPAQPSIGQPDRHYFTLRRASGLDLQRLLLRFPRVYGFLQDLLTPTLTLQRWRDEVPAQCDHVVLNLGCGAVVLDPELINVDMVAFPHVDIRTDFARPLPIRSASVDGVLSIAVLGTWYSPRHS